MSKMAVKWRAGNRRINGNATLYACFMGYVVQAIVNNFVPLLFVTFQTSYDISLTQITMLVTLNFGFQLVVDMMAIHFVDRIGYRASALIAHICAATGLILLPLLPEMLPDPFVGLLIAVLIYAIGGGLLEVLLSPIVEACPVGNKEKAMSLLHSFYCWGHVGVVLLSTIFFAIFGVNNWKILALLWAAMPIGNAVAFSKVPIPLLTQEHGVSLSLKKLMGQSTFWILFLLMLCAGASEQGVSQWASTFAEKGLRVSKTIGDLAGPMIFAALMGTARALYGKFGDRIRLHKVMQYSGVLCVASYLMIALSPIPALSLIGCGICGFSVGVLWPGTFSQAALSIPRGGTAMYALLALAGDLGCAGGPTLVGMVSGAFGGDLKAGILAAMIFPVVLIAGVRIVKSRRSAP